MRVGGKHYRTIWAKPGDDKVIQIIDQRDLPHSFTIEDIVSVDDMTRAIKEMHLRGAGLIGAAAGYGMYLAALEAPSDAFDEYVRQAGERLKATRPTAVNLAWAVERQLDSIKSVSSIDEKIRVMYKTASLIADEDAEFCRRIGEHGLKLIDVISSKKRGGVVNILTHCNAGWLAFVDYGTATAPIYAAHEKGIKVHVWVDETRPWNQGARLTAWELGEEGVPHTIIADNVGGHLMQHGRVDMVIVGSDRTTYTGYVCNKIGTYLKALAAKDNGVPFYAAVPSSSIDWKITNGLKDIPIEERGEDEVKYITGYSEEGKIQRVLLAPKDSKATNYAFDVTPPRLVTGIITERGICDASWRGILGMFPERKG